MLRDEFLAFKTPDTRVEVGASSSKLPTIISGRYLRLWGLLYDSDTFSPTLEHRSPLAHGQKALLLGNDLCAVLDPVTLIGNSA